MPTVFLRPTPLVGMHRRLIFFGLVRPYKGLDVLLRALAAGPSDVRLRVVGEFWGGTDATEALCSELGIIDRVELRDGYVAAEEVPVLFSDVDALVLPYRNATGSQGVWTGFEFGVPVIATRAGHLADDIRDGVDGLVAEPDDVESLAGALTSFYTARVAETMRDAVMPVDPNPYWDRYLHALTVGESVSPTRVKDDELSQIAAPHGGKLLPFAKLGAAQVLWARGATQTLIYRRRGRLRPFPTRQPAPDVLKTTADAAIACSECRALEQPRPDDLPN